MGETAMQQLTLPLRAEIDIARDYAHQLVNQTPDDALLAWYRRQTQPSPVGPATLFLPEVTPSGRQALSPDPPIRLRLLRPA